jgi:hypothetical protein
MKEPDGLGMTLQVPERLVPYLTDLYDTGLWGPTLHDVAIRLIERSIESEIGIGTIPYRVNGEVHRKER